MDYEIWKKKNKERHDRGIQLDTILRREWKQYRTQNVQNQHGKQAIYKQTCMDPEKELFQFEGSESVKLYG